MEDLVGSRVYCCFKCRNVVGLHDDIVDKHFVGGHSRAFLFARAMNVVEGPKMDKQLISGIHMVGDVYCCECTEILGWKYHKVHLEQHKYKEGKFVFKKSKIAKAVDFEFEIVDGA